VDILRAVQPKLKRSELDHLAKFYSLDAQGVESLFAAAEARPTRAEGLRFLAHCLRTAGVLSLAAGLVFFVAANWGRLEVFGRFLLVELVLLGCAVVAFIRPPPSFAGRGALFLAFVATGALLALFGQTYQTGADVYELFLGWALLGLPLALVAQWSMTSATWVLVFNTALLLYSGWQPTGGMLWMLLGSRHVSPSYILLAACWLNLLLWFIADWRESAVVPGWVRRILVSAAFTFCTWAGMVALFDADRSGYPREFDGPALLASLATMAAAAAYAYRKRQDIYPLAVVAGSLIVIGTGIVIKLFDNANEGVLLLSALWLIGSSTVAGRVLLRLMRQWRDEARA
jgi:uncharacterized membrane protein